MTAGAIRPKVIVLGASGLLIAAGAGLAGGQIYLRAKAALAAVLIERAWRGELADGRARPPWPWADMHPVASLEVPRLGLRRAILSGASGSSFAFGLAHVSGTALPGEPGNVAVAGHRDTWAAFLKELRPGDEILLRGRSDEKRYTVETIRVVDRARVEALEPTDEDRLTLVTCYPFGALLRGPLRLVILCRKSEEGNH